MDTVLPPKTSNRKKYIIIAVISVLVLIVGVIAGLILMGRRQLVEQEASTPTGIAKVNITPSNKTVNQGDTFTANVTFDTANTAIAAITIQLEYPFQGDAPPISISDVQINSKLPVEELWDFPINSVKKEGNKIVIKIAGFSNSVSGYISSGEETLATITFKADAPGSITAQFDQTVSKITKKSDGADTLLTPQSTGTYTVSGTVATATPTSIPSSSASPTPKSTSTPKPATGSATPVPIPVTGISIPSILGVGLGTLLVIGAALLAL